MQDIVDKEDKSRFQRKMMIYLTKVSGLLLKGNRGSLIILMLNRLQTNIGQAISQVSKILILDSTHPQRNSIVGYTS